MELNGKFSFFSYFVGVPLRRPTHQMIYQKVQGQNVERKFQKTKCGSDEMSKAKSNLKKEERRRKILSFDIMSFDVL